MDPPPPVQHLLVLSHPAQTSFCAAVARRWQDRVHHNHQTCTLRDLYQDGFDPVLSEKEQPGKAGFDPAEANVAENLRIQQMDVLVFVYPVWFGAPPAMLKGYIERVVGCGISFEGTQEAARPLASVRLVQIATSASSEPSLAEKGVRGALHTLYDQYLAGVFGAKDVQRLHLDLIGESMDERHAAAQLAKVDQLADHVCAAANADRWENARSREAIDAGSVPVPPTLH